MGAYLAIAIGGLLGCWARYALSNLVQGALGRDFPFATLSVNVLACFLIGFLFVATNDRLTIGPLLRLGVLTGFLGGFSTFSTFTMETVLLAEQGALAKSVLYLAASIVFGLAATVGGVYVARNI